MVIGLVVLVLTAIAAVVFSADNSNTQTKGVDSNTSSEVSMTTTNTEQAMTEKNDADTAMQGQTSPVAETVMNQDPEKTMAIKSPGAYKDYSSQTLQAEQAKGSKVVLFFHAPWCPFCKAADKAFLEKISQIPTGVTVLKTDYDSEKELKQKYAITYQHTFVQIDSAGNQVSKWSGGDVDNLVKYLK